MLEHSKSLLLHELVPSLSFLLRKNSSCWIFWPVNVRPSNFVFGARPRDTSCDHFGSSQIAWLIGHGHS